MRKSLAILSILLLVPTALFGCKKTQEPISCAYKDTFIEQDVSNIVVTYSDSFAKNIAVVPVDEANSENSEKLVGEGGLLINISTNEVLFQKNAHMAAYPASTTKVMTAIIALENEHEETHVMGREVIINEANAVTCDYRIGDTVTFETILHGALLRSGNDAANALAMCAASSMDDFVNMMNDKALALGATHTHYVNANGLFDESHITTPYDLYLIFNEAIQLKPFISTVSKAKYTSVFKRSTGQKDYKINAEYISTNPYFTNQAVAPDYIKIIGGKSGYTSAAGRCYALLVEANSQKYIAIVMKSNTKDDLSYDLNYLLSYIPNEEQE